jgi:hypothetical protein
MPRRARIAAAGYPMHVILRGIDRSAVFFAGEDRQFLLKRRSRRLLLGLADRRFEQQTEAKALLERLEQ